MAIVLMVLALFHNFLPLNTHVYMFAMISTSFVSILDAIGQAGLELSFLEYLPLYAKGLGWVIPAVIGAMLGLFYDNLKARRFAHLTS